MPHLLDDLARVAHLLRVKDVVVLVSRGVFVLIARGDHARIQRTRPNEVKASVTTGQAEQDFVMRGDEWTGDVIEARPVEERPASEHEEQIEQLQHVLEGTEVH